MDNGGAGGLLDNLQLIIPLVLIVVFGIFMRRRKKGAGGSKTDVAFSLLSAVKNNQKLVESLSMNWQAKKKFSTSVWKVNENKIDFLGGRLQGELSTAFTLAEDCNDRIEKSKQYKSTSYMMGIPTDKLASSLAASKEGLEIWLRQNMQTEPPQRRRGGLFG